MYSQQAQRLICLAAASWSYEISSDRLEELCGLKVGEATVREIAQRRGAAANEWMRSAPEAVCEFHKADGDVDFTTDGTSVNTMGGWREMKVGIFSKPDRGESATVEEWESRSLPKQKTCVAIAAINRSEDFGRRWKAWRTRLWLVDALAISVLADGTKWIWEERLEHMPPSEDVLDIFHAGNICRIWAKSYTSALKKSPRTRIVLVRRCCNPGRWVSLGCWQQAMVTVIE